MDVLDAPSPYGELIDKVMDRDREYFRRNPGERVYVRPYVPGELWPLRYEADFVEVEQVAPGVRLRRPVSVGVPLS